MALVRYNPILIGLIGLFTIFSINIGFDLVPDVQTPANAEHGSPYIQSDGGVRQYATVSSDGFQVLVSGQWTDVMVKGVNMGMAKPGHFPGEAAITYDEYLRWLDLIGAMNANAVRTYTVHPPQFYRALRDHNRMHPGSELHLLQGVYGNEELVGGSENVFEPILTMDMKEGIEAAYDVIFGNHRSTGRVGVPKGIYDADVSEYVLGIIIGQEWDPRLVSSTNSLNRNSKDHDGTLLMTVGASPFEIWLANLLEHAASYGLSRYSYQVPLSFVDHQALDKLSHPLEPEPSNDMVSLDPDRIIAKRGFKAGLFATFHAYPYYPDFMGLEYGSAPAANDDPTAYGRYLHDLKAHHTTPILIGEFGIPNSMGTAHCGPDGMHQGGLTEDEQGACLASMYRSIVSEGLMGGVVFSWQDEWFKTTWNVRGGLDPQGKPNWKDPLNCEESYGLLSFEPGPAPTITPDGNVDDWEALGLIGPRDGHTVGGTGPLKASYDDEAYIYLLLDLDGIWRNDVRLMFDTLPGNGTGAELHGDFAGAEFLLDIPSSGDIRFFVDGAYDVLGPDGPGYGMGFVPFRTTTGQDRITRDGRLPGEVVLAKGADICPSPDGRWLEVRVPWAMLNFRDPSKGVIAGDMLREGPDASLMIEGLRAAALVVDVFDNGRTIACNELFHELEGWGSPTYRERPKAAYDAMKEAFSVVN